MAPRSPNEIALLESLNEPTLMVEGYVVVIANRPALDLLGPNIVGRDVRLAIRHPQALEHILAHRSVDLDVTGIGEVGRSWRLLIRPLGDNASLLRMIDRSEAVSAEKMRVDFVANASHELRTPLSTVLGYAETLADESGLSPDALHKFGRTIRDEAKRMLRIIEDLMSLSRIEANRFVAPADRVSVEEIVQTAIANASSSQCEFVVRLQPKLAAVRGDQAELTQLLDNLLSNAVRYGCSDADSKVEVSADQDSSSVKITVTDHGIGISREHLPRLTERFYRVDAGRSRATGGTGLGLAIVKHIVERHRGSLEIESSVGAGTSVSVRLPAVT